MDWSKSSAMVVCAVVRSKSRNQKGRGSERQLLPGE
jgi:hypothetical protein